MTSGPIIETYEALGAERPILGCGISESLLLIYISESKILGGFSEIFGFKQFHTQTGKHYPKVWFR